MLRRKITEQLNDWATHKDEKCLVVQGAKQAGKTYAVKQFAKARKIKCYISMEERMACGIGACLGCVCKTTSKDAHTNVNNARVCVDGPVFDAGEVEL